ncbi:flagellar assembly protein FliW [Tersicoccus phoenicis]|uniref:Flagellar assembly protein FliW n=1 Tax=Tersicoccus phoenicis TaxID=554083 RepID=A0A1R1L7N5_9MICC|nr:flagellar assembly protein FliW [Tersicoccus phoenicis]OMH23535.1 flagellar assembly protein FliW [Tersicoccus phoenicis]
MSALTLVEPMPGLAPWTAYTLDAVTGAPGLFSLRPAAETDLRLYLLDASVYVPGYAPDLTDAAEGLGLAAGESVRVLVVATPGEDATTVNLLAPVIVNERTGTGAQVILSDQDYPLRAPLAR